jgi:hypothetical protein
MMDAAAVKDASEEVIASPGKTFDVSFENGAF